MAEDAVGGEPFSGIDRENYREFSGCRGDRPLTSPDLTGLYDQYGTSKTRMELGINRDLSGNFVTSCRE
jgi:hypothetical protein